MLVAGLDELRIIFESKRIYDLCQLKHLNSLWENFGNFGKVQNSRFWTEAIALWVLSVLVATALLMLFSEFSIWMVFAYNLSKLLSIPIKLLIKSQWNLWNDQKTVKIDETRII